MLTTHMTDLVMRTLDRLNITNACAERSAFQRGLWATCAHIKTELLSDIFKICPTEFETYGNVSKLCFYWSQPPDLRRPYLEVR